ncbi:aldo/keto reductase [Streptomyces sp. NBC_00467]|uniref:aldo/keto reductase n=1 Tax=Streptomyces sp. NBC_00467 TaxID=2975752 RepID=UPI002E1907B8
MTIKTFSLGGELTINRLGFGAMRLSMGTFAGPARDPETGIAVLRRAVELGVNHIDTAGFYGRDAVWANELIRTALTPYRDDLMIATKVGPLPGPNGVPSGQATADQLRGLVEADLRCLGLNRFDLVYLRVGGMNGPGGESIAERFSVLAELRAEGLIRHLGVSNVDSAQLAEARAIAPVAAVQNRHTSDKGLLMESEEAGIAHVPYFPLGGGVGSVPLDAERLGKVAARVGATTAQVAIASLLATSPTVLAVSVTRTCLTCEANWSAPDVGLRAMPVAAARRYPRLSASGTG